jgi:hypothetical protein
MTADGVDCQAQVVIHQLLGLGRSLNIPILYTVPYSTTFLQLRGLGKGESTFTQDRYEIKNERAAKVSSFGSEGRGPNEGGCERTKPASVATAN